MTTVPKAPSPAVFSNAKLANTAKNNENSMKNSNFSTQTALHSSTSGSSAGSLNEEPFTVVRTSKRATKASLESLKDSQKVFTLAKRPEIVPTAGTSPAESIAATAEEPQPPTEDVDMVDDSHAPERKPSPSELLENIRDQFPDVALALQAVIEGLVSKVASLEKQLAEKPVPPTYASALSANAAKRKMSDELRKKLSEAADKPAKTQILADSWASRSHKRNCVEPAADPHIAEEEDTLEVVHLAGFDLMRDEPRATIAAVLNKHYELPLDTIVNVSPIAPKLQELVISSKRLDSLRSVVARSGGALKMTTKLDARLPGYETSDTKILADSLARFNTRLDREIERLHKSPARKLKEAADLLVAYKRDGTRKSTPRARRSPIFASAFLDEESFSPASTAMVTEQI